MNEKGEVRSASEFKQIFEDAGVSHAPYKCPFCEARYEDRCIVTVCVRAPHFKLPNGTYHRNGCNGEAGDAAIAITSSPSSGPKRSVVGDIDLPEALVKRRKPTLVRKEGDVREGLMPDAAEVVRRKKMVSADKTISAHFTTSHLRPIVHAYKNLRELTGKAAISKGHERGTSQYNAVFTEVLNLYRLSLYGQRLTYGTAFQSSKLVPEGDERIYSGRGKVEISGNHILIKDLDQWPTVRRSKENMLPFVVRMNRAPEHDATTSHLRMLHVLEGFAAVGQVIEWYGLGIPVRLEQNFELALDTLDHIYWIEPSLRKKA
nr:hypothetical protein [Herbaspirillum sp. ASV7]